jgi:hypothetical protein
MRCVRTATSFMPPASSSARAARRRRAERSRQSASGHASCPPAGESGGTLERTGWLTPYTAETIVEDAVRAGRGARLELTVAARTTEGLVRAQRQFARLGTRGVQVTVRRDDRPTASRAHSSADGVAERHQVTAADSHLALSHQLLDQLTGTCTTVTITGYVGGDPWQADDLIACVGQPVKRFGDGTPAEQGQALSDRGPAHLVEGDPLGCGDRATARGHHVHVDGPSGQAVDRTRDGIRKEPRHLEIGLGRVGNG